MIKYTNQFLAKLEDLVAESDYILRYEKGNFKSGYCLLRDQKIMIINKFYTTEGKINTLLDILKLITLETSRFSEKSKKLYEELSQTEINIWRLHFLERAHHKAYRLSGARVKYASPLIIETSA